MHKNDNKIDYKNAFWGAMFALAGVAFVALAAAIYQLVQYAFGFCPSL